jgi:hypothetical protein
MWSFVDISGIFGSVKASPGKYSTDYTFINEFICATWNTWNSDLTGKSSKS